MKVPAMKILHIAFAGGIAAFGLLANDAAWHGRNGSVLSTAEARIGRPLTPMSYAGVARRTTRRAYGYGAGAVAAGAYGYAAAPIYAAPRAGCVQVVDAYGSIYYQCP